MSHNHAHSGHCHHGANNNIRVLCIALITTVAMMAVELIAGFISNSLALISDAVHMLTDSGSMVLSLFAAWLARRPANQQMTYGYQRAEILGALINGLAIWLLSGVLIWEALERLVEVPSVEGHIVTTVGIIGLAVNGFNLWLLHHGQKENLNMRSAYLHIFSDLLGSLSAIIAGLIITYTGWMIADPILTILFSLLILRSSWHVVMEALRVLMQGTPKDLDIATIQTALEAIPGVQQVHALHVWTVAGSRVACSVHLISKESQQVLKAADELLSKKFNVTHAAIQIEDPESFSSENCHNTH